MKCLIIRDNQGNHTGSNVEWSLLGVYDSVREAQKDLDGWAAEEKCIKEMGSNFKGIFSYDKNDWEGRSEKVQEYLSLSDDPNRVLVYEYLFGKETHFEDDGKNWHIITEEELETFFDGGVHGFKPFFIKEIEEEWGLGSIEKK